MLSNYRDPGGLVSSLSTMAKVAACGESSHWGSRARLGMARIGPRREVKCMRKVLTQEEVCRVHMARHTEAVSGL